MSIPLRPLGKAFLKPAVVVRLTAFYASVIALAVVVMDVFRGCLCGCPCCGLWRSLLSSLSVSGIIVSVRLSPLATSIIPY